MKYRAISSSIRFGAAYYPEYLPGRDLEADFALMREANFTVIRVGESVWSTWEPEEGRFDLDWLAPTLDEAYASGIGVIIGTPTYAVPMWLARTHPEIVAASSTGSPLQWGSRQEVDFTHGAYRFYAERIIRAVVGRYRDHPAVIGYQVDNEPGVRLLYNDDVFARFKTFLKRRYGTLERLNDEWGLVYWSHRLSDWDELWRPDGNAQPQYDLAWRRFQAELVSSFIEWQVKIVRELSGKNQFVTTCISYDQVGVEDVELSAPFDIAAGNAYYEMEDTLEHPSAAPRSSGPMGWIVRGAWAVAELSDLMFSSKQAPFFVTETNAGSIGYSAINQSPYDGQWRQVAWLMVARGARMIEYWHWNTLPYGTETFWGGVLPHSGRPGRAYAEIAQIGSEFRQASDVFAEAEPDYDLTVLFDSDSKFALAHQPPLGDGGRPDADSYRRIISAFTRGAFDAKRQTRLIRPQQLFPSRGGSLSAREAAKKHPVLLVAAFYTAGDPELTFLVDYARAGGHLVLGPKTGYADREARARRIRQPAGLAEAAGAWYDEAVNPGAPVPLTFAPGLSGSGCAVDYIEHLVADEADVLAAYVHPHHARWAAVTSRAWGQGQITVIGMVPDQTLARELVGWLVPEPVSDWTDLPPSATAHTSTDLGRWTQHVIHNWGWASSVVVAPMDLVDTLDGSEHAQGTSIEMGPWDVRVFQSRIRPSRS